MHQVLERQLRRLADAHVLEALVLARCVADLRPALFRPVGGDGCDRIPDRVVAGRMAREVALAAVQELGPRADQVRRGSRPARLDRSSCRRAGSRGRRGRSSPGDQLMPQSSSCESRPRPAGEGRLDDPRHAVVDAGDHLVAEGVGSPPQRSKARCDVVPAERAERFRLDRPRRRLHRRQQAADEVMVELVAVPLQQAVQRRALEVRPLRARPCAWRCR